MFIISITYVKPLEEVDKHMDAHWAFLEKYYEADVFLIWGRKVPRVGGIIIGQADSLKIMQKIANEDPFVTEGVATVEVTEFNVSKAKPGIKELLR
ncbi:YciI family protein [Mucilaginibacter ginkgonis]|uniref:GTP cyclohydrolase n=1 Tax=Mucilaginibacter ginkgonis TaxID=2682091 RepID=A0A6I4I2X8_9SPHI|nr:YciI family protein [Mucilaginibacter ginkgonis]QQL49646.1 GTP cyclohydrolase [Mucilaginibacter ginkgonis]